MATYLWEHMLLADDLAQVRLPGQCAPKAWRQGVRGGKWSVESFGGIGGARRALEILGVTPGFHLHLEIDEKAKRVIDKQDITGGGRNGL